MEQTDSCQRGGGVGELDGKGRIISPKIYRHRQVWWAKVRAGQWGNGASVRVSTIKIKLKNVKGVFLHIYLPTITGFFSTGPHHHKCEGSAALTTWEQVKKDP